MNKLFNYFNEISEIENELKKMQFALKCTNDAIEDYVKFRCIDEKLGRSALNDFSIGVEYASNVYQRIKILEETLELERKKYSEEKVILCNLINQITDDSVVNYLYQFTNEFVNKFGK